MRYLKRIFEEVSQDEYERLLDFCEGNLVYLLDDIWKLKINKKTAVYPNTGYYDIVIYTFNNGNSVPVNWSDVQDYLIPFFRRLIENYDLVDINPRYTSKIIRLENNQTLNFGTKYLSEEDVYNDNYQIDAVTNINIKVKKEK